MRFKILKDGTLFHVLLANGKYKLLDKYTVKHFLLNYDETASKEPLHDELPEVFDDYCGELVASLDENMSLIIHSPELFRYIMMFDANDCPYYTLQQYAELHEHNDSVIRKLCLAGRIPGALQIGHGWLIPKGTPYPKDMRAGRDMSKRRKKQ